MTYFDVRDRRTGGTKFTAEIAGKGDEFRPHLLRLAVGWAIKTKTSLAGADLREADLREADLREADLREADLREADLSGVNLREADLRGVNLRGVNLREADLREADLRRANLRGADLRGVNLRGVNLRGVDLREANLRGADLHEADLRGVRGIADRVIDGGLRSDGYRFLLTRTGPGEFRVKAGCRNFTVSEARKHWNATRPTGEPLGDETRLIIKHMLAIAKLRGWQTWTETD